MLKQGELEDGQRLLGVGYSSYSFVDGYGDLYNWLLHESFSCLEKWRSTVIKTRDRQNGTFEASQEEVTQHHRSLTRGSGFIVVTRAGHTPLFRKK
ncbi:hypothetical protein [Salimicrobium halophilum]|uniref:Uncharacterized protein n=1 Tax=Salimicrobium halophilum TaxID=86666 RepID=A0A1G8SEH3_9BACI|nr:hypothetical protein [Salimicrobium halophilum]SDJ27608.1 hypothetical protein SAMN04490247_1415 [Salimicrobium halophilum]